ncbi:NADPH:quinone reductase [Sulfitobacter aestuarii]|uniref:NADPH:quinone reductase n=1 Tax=Sulfitobacter aestuarii TaxID=2161676 RepID=A0ABW5U292_9RHOB
MQAISYQDFGAARDVLTLGEIETPEPQAGEVRVRLVYSGVNPSDVKARAGGRPGVSKPPYPRIVPHSDGAGEIDAVGAGVDPARIGQRVWIWNGQWQRAFGSAAQYITLPAVQAVRLPDQVGFETGASLGIPGLTACHAVFGGGDVGGQTVLVQGGGGTVGYLAVQLAKWGGARVIASCSPRDHERVLSAGADAVCDHGAPDLVDRVLAASGGRPVDQIVEVEFGRNVESDTALIAPNGRIAAYGSAREMQPVLPFYPLMFKAVTLDLLLIYLLAEAPRNAAIDRLHDALSAGALTCPVQARYALADTAMAHEAVEAGSRSGAILVACQD